MHSVYGRAEPEEVKSLATKFATISDYKADAHRIIESTFDQFAVDRIRGFSSATPSFNDGNHPNVFVLGCNAIIRHLSEPHKKCAMTLMSADPISTFCILLDPSGGSDSFHVEALSAARHITYVDRATANAEYLANYAAAGALHVDSGAVMNQLMSIKKHKFGNSSTLCHDICKYINDTYRTVCSSGALGGINIYPCLSDDLRKRVQFYDEARFASAVKFYELYPSMDPKIAAGASHDASTVRSQVNSLKHTILACLETNRSLFQCRAEETAGDNSVTPSLTKSCAHYFRTEFFVHVPLPAAAWKTYNAATENHIKGNTDDQSGMLAGLDLNYLTPLSFSRLYLDNFGSLY